MNPEFIKLQNQVTDMEQKIDDALKVINGLKIDNQKKINSNVKIPPGIACKVAYDQNGLILKGDQLRASDVPMISIDGVEGLRKILDSKLSTNDVKSITFGEDKSSLPNNEIVGTGIKINYNSDGSIVSTSELLESDIPMLSIEHIKDLKAEMDFIKSALAPVSETSDTHQIDPGTFTKITYDSNGRVVSGSRLTMDDIPIDIITRMNMIEDRFPSLASQSSVDIINKLLHKKLDANPITTPGIYTKITIDSNGLVTHGERLTIKDLPEININDIVNLAGTLRNKADQSDLIEINNNVSRIIGSLGKLGDIVNIRSTLQSKAEDRDLKELSARVTSLQQLMDTISTKIPNELILEQLQQIQHEVSSLSGRIIVLEKKMGIPDLYDTTK